MPSYSQGSGYIRIVRLDKMHDRRCIILKEHDVSAVRLFVVLLSFCNFPRPGAGRARNTPVVQPRRGRAWVTGRSGHSRPMDRRQQAQHTGRLAGACPPRGPRRFRERPLCASGADEQLVEGGWSAVKREVAGGGEVGS